MPKRLPPKDVAIIGLGWTASILANELTDAGLDVVAVERGPWRKGHSASSFRLGLPLCQVPIELVFGNAFATVELIDAAPVCLTWRSAEQKDASCCFRQPRISGIPCSRSWRIRLAAARPRYYKVPKRMVLAREFPQLPLPPPHLNLDNDPLRS